MLDAKILALSDPTRRAILVRLAQGEATVWELAKPFVPSQPAISQHIKVLVEAGLIRRRVDGTRRPCRLAPQGQAVLEHWLGFLRRTTAMTHQRLDPLLAYSNRTENPDAPVP